MCRLSRKFHIYICLFLLYCPIISYCQTLFKLTLNDSHYFINAPLNGQGHSNIMLESGIPGILINEENFNKYFTDSLFVAVDSGYTEIKSFYGNHNVNSIRYGKVYIGDVVYEGTIYVIDKYDQIGVPVHLLQSMNDSTNNLVQIDFRNNTLSFIRRDSIIGLKLHQYVMKEIIPEPIIETTLWLSDRDGHNGVIKGDFILDFGNRTPLFLFYRNSIVSQFLKNNNYSLSTAKDQKGRNVGYGIYANLCKVGNKSVKNVSVGISNRIKISNTMGSIGPSMYASSFLIFDTKNMLVYYQ